MYRPHCIVPLIPARNMKSALALASLATLVAATPDPQITARAQLGKRQATDPALLGWVSGASGCTSIFNTACYNTTKTSIH